MTEDMIKNLYESIGYVPSKTVKKAKKAAEEKHKGLMSR